MSEHTQEQGLRVHHLVNLGGLIAVARLDREPPDFLLGALISVAHERTALTVEQRERVARLGREKLDERASAKRAWKSWRRTREVYGLTLSEAEVRRLIAALGGSAPVDQAEVVAALMGLLGRVSDGVVAVANARG
jgi:conjugative transfer protein TraD